MIKTKIYLCSSIAITALWFWSGCGAPQPGIKQDPKGSTTVVKGQNNYVATTRADIIRDIENGKGLKLPENYDQDTSFRKLVMICSVKKVELKGEHIPQGIDKSLSLMLQTKLGQSKRFDLYCLFNNGTIALAKELGDLGELDLSKLESVQPPAPDVYCNATVVLSRRQFETKEGLDRVTYTCDLIVNLLDNNRRDVGRPIQITKKTQPLKIIFLGGKRFGGLKLEEETQAIRDTTFECLKELYGRLGHQFPVTSEVTGYDPGFDKDYMPIDKGVDQGLRQDQQMVLWVKLPSGSPYAMAYCEVEPGQNKSRIQILSRNKKNDSYRKLWENLETDGWLKGEGKDYKLYTTSKGLAPPQEWEKPID